VVGAAVSGEIIAVVIANSSLKVYNLDRNGAEVFHVPIKPIPVGFLLSSGGKRFISRSNWIAISGDKKMVALGYDSSCYVWSLDSGSTRRFALVQGVVAHNTCLAFSDDGTHLAAGFSNAELHEWVVSSGAEGRQFLWPNGVDDTEREEVLR
jgi:WD40 repeat protein